MGPKRNPTEPAKPDRDANAPIDPNLERFIPSLLNGKFLAACFMAILLMMVMPETTWGRMWTTRDGRTYEGLFSGMVDRVVEIDANGRIIRLSWDDLSKADQQYVQQVTSGTYQPAGTIGVTDNRAELFIDTRTWTDDEGTQIQGRFGGIDGQTIKIVGNDKTTLWEQKRLSVADQIYVRQIKKALDPAFHGQYWVIQGRNSFRGTFVQAEGANVLLWQALKDDGVLVPFNQISSQEQMFTCETLDLRKRREATLKGASYRPWRNTAESWMMPARLKGLQKDVVILEQEHDDFFVKLSELSADDQTYVLPFFKSPSTASSTPSTWKQAPSNSFSIQGINLAAIGMSVFALAVLTLLIAISIKYVRESYHRDD